MLAQAVHDSREFELRDAAATLALGKALGALLSVGDVVCLHGDLGAGKTTLARGAVEAWMGAPHETPSPTFTIMQLYEGPRGELAHMDLYRLRGEQDLEEAGVVDALQAGPCLIEWPERLGAWTPDERLDVFLEQAGAGRRAVLKPHGAWRDRLVTI